MESSFDISSLVQEFDEAIDHVHDQCGEDAAQAFRDRFTHTEIAWHDVLTFEAEWMEKGSLVTTTVSNEPNEEIFRDDYP